MSSRANKWGCIIGAWIGMISGIIAWLITTEKLYGTINLVTSFNDFPMLAGNVVSIGVGGIIALGSTAIWPENFNFEITRNLAGVRIEWVQEVKLGVSVSEREKMSGGDNPKGGIEPLEAEPIRSASAAASIVSCLSILEPLPH